MSATCADHGAPADGVCVVCKRPMCKQCPLNGGRCQACTVEQLMVPTRREVDRAAGRSLLKAFFILALLAAVLAGGCIGCQRWLSEHIHT